MIDIHCHMLPGIDDGPGRLDESLDMARLAVANGITEVVVTPHIHAGRQIIPGGVLARPQQVLLGRRQFELPSTQFQDMAPSRHLTATDNMDRPIWQDQLETLHPIAGRPVSVAP